MGYNINLDEVDEWVLIRELDRRKHARLLGNCDYCGNQWSSPVCRFPERHRSPADQQAAKMTSAKICPNCNKPDYDNDHWDDLDGPNRAGWACRNKSA